jgi:hypothetical protein
MASTRAVVVGLSPAINDVDPADARMRLDVAELTRMLGEESANWHLGASPQPGEKGGAVEILVNLTEPTSVVAICAAISAWVSRSRDRSVNVTIQRSEGATELRVDGESVSNDTLRAALQAAMDTGPDG